MAQKFTDVDITFDCLGFSEEKKILIYRIISAIIHLGNIEFEGTDEVKISETSKIHIDIAAELTDMSSDEIVNALLFRSIDILSSKIL